MNWLVWGALFIALVSLLLLFGLPRVPRHRRQEWALEEGRSYAKSVLALVENNPHLAIEQLVQTAARSSGAIEAHFALGALFRERGESRRAIRVHQMLLLRPDLDKETRARLYFQLALDLEAAHAPQRAVRVLNWLVREFPRQLPAWEKLGELHQRAGAWDRAAVAYQRLNKLSGNSAVNGGLVPHMFAELASAALSRGDLDSARSHLRHAAATDTVPVHVWHVSAQYQEALGNPAGAAKQWERAIRQAPLLAPFFVPHLEHAFFAAGQLSELSQVLDRLLADFPDNVHLRLASARFEAKRHPERAWQELTALLEEHPRFLLGRREAARWVLDWDPENIVRLRSVLAELLQLLDDTNRGYRCATCGLAQADLFWRCPRCGNWDTVGVAWGRRSGEA